MDGFMNKIKVLSRILSIFFTTIAISIPFVAFGFDWLVYTGSQYTFLGITIGATTKAIAQSLPEFILSYLITLIPSSILVICFGSLAYLFGLYANGLYFTKQNTRLYNWVGWSLIIHFFTTILAIILNSILLTGPNYNYNLNFSGLSFSDILTGLVILCISWVFHEANKINAENQLTI